MNSVSASQTSFQQNMNCYWKLLRKLLFFQWLALLVVNQAIVVSAKNLDISNGPLSAGAAAHGPTDVSIPESPMGKDSNNCDGAFKFFDRINITIKPDYSSKGHICGGHCCSNATEDELMHKSKRYFERLLRHHTKSLTGILVTTSTSFQDHVLELSRQSENKTFSVFSKVYRRMLPLSKQLIHDLYSNIRSQLTTERSFDLDMAVHNFFVNLFPIAYHHAVHSNSNSANGDLHDDYINCLKHTFDNLQPFGDIPEELRKNLVQSIDAATVFISSLETAADILASTENLEVDYLTKTCTTHLLKMSYCSECNGISKDRVKPCYGYCLNVMRGCLAQYVGVLDIPWSKVAEAIERLVTSSIQSDTGIINSIKGLDAKLSEAIMRAMENGPELEKKVKKTCGTPKLLPPQNVQDSDSRLQQSPPVKWATPPDAELLNFLATMATSRDFYSKIIDNLCKDNEYQRKDRHCWTGDRIGDYTLTIMETGADTQRYNPEVPLADNSYNRVTKLNELVDKLIKLRSTIVKTVPLNSRSYSDVQGDMARHDEEGSGQGGPGDEGDEDLEGSGLEQSGDGPPTSTQDPIAVSPRTEAGCSSTIRISIIAIFINSLVLLNSYVFTSP